jgi:hypothetical protein
MNDDEIILCVECAEWDMVMMVVHLYTRACSSFALDEFVSKVVPCQVLMGGSIEFS